MKKIITLALILTLSLPTSVLASPNVKVNGQYIQPDTPPIIQNNRVLVPLRSIFESLNAQVSWDGDTKIITAQREGKNISLQIGSQNVSVNGQNQTIDTPPIIQNNRTMVPIRFVSESLGEPVFWDSQNSIVVVGNEKLYNTDGTLLYEGPIVNGKLTGEGKLYKQEKVVYQGAFENSTPNGKGILYDYTQSVPTQIPVQMDRGEVKQILEEVLSEMSIGPASGVPTIAPIVNTTPGQPYGIIQNTDTINTTNTNQATLYYADGELLYKGEIQGKVLNGQGILYSNSGAKIYEGRFVNGEMSGQGKLYNESGLVYEGQFQDGEFGGKGIIYDKEGKIVQQGEFKKGVLNEN